MGTVMNKAVGSQYLKYTVACLDDEFGDDIIRVTVEKDLCTPGRREGR